MRVYVLDVGQGSCAVIALGGRRAIVVDAGREYGVLKRLLHRLSVVTVPLLVITHNNQDHWGGAPQLLTDTSITTEQVCFHIDQKMPGTGLWAKLEELIQTDVLDPETQLRNLEYDDKAHPLWEAADGTAELKVLAPTFGQVFRATSDRDANAASGVLVLAAGEKRVVLPGDAHFRQWEAIRARAGKPLACDVLAVPHHAGVTWDDGWTAAEVAAGLDTLYTDYVRPRYAVVSVGTSNTYGHPRGDVVAALRRAGATVLCTQMTGGCSADLEARRAAPLLPLLLEVPGSSRPAEHRTPKGDSANVACAGTVVIDLAPGRVVVRRVHDHQAGVDRLGPPPLCRR